MRNTDDARKGAKQAMSEQVIIPEWFVTELIGGRNSYDKFIHHRRDRSIEKVEFHLRGRLRFTILSLDKLGKKWELKEPTVLEKLKGVDPNITGGEEPEDFVKNQRLEWD